MEFEEDMRERAVLVGIERPKDPWPVESSLDELERLVDTVGAVTVARTTQRLDAPNPRTFIGSGKASEVAELCRAYAADVVVFDDELTPSQQANLEKTVDKSVKVIDRTALILDIFALHATTREGRLQVERSRVIHRVADRPRPKVPRQSVAVARAHDELVVGVPRRRLRQD